MNSLGMLIGMQFVQRTDIHYNLNVACFLRLVKSVSAPQLAVFTVTNYSIIMYMYSSSDLYSIL